MPKYWVKNYFAHGRFPKVGQKQKTENKEEEEERLNDGENNGQAMHGARVKKSALGFHKPILDSSWFRKFVSRNVQNLQ